MAITKDTYSTNLVLELDLGVDEKGKQKERISHYLNLMYLLQMKMCMQLEKLHQSF
ncbi:hypothetical protein K134307016_p10430 (plasmid) [Clostridium tetani]|nr:hypothetical protein K134307016_p10430 [Clostridium tetani]